MFIVQLPYSDDLNSLDIQVALPWMQIYVWIPMNTNPFDLFYYNLCYRRKLLKTLLVEKLEECLWDTLPSVKTFERGNLNSLYVFK